MAASTVEVWENNVDGRVSMSVPGPRDSLRKLTVAGKGQRLRILPEDRAIVEEGIRDPQNNPFANGKLSQVGGLKRKPPEDLPDLGNQDFSDDDLSVFFTLSPTDFLPALEELSEANVRRLQSIFRERGGTVAQQEILVDYIEKTWPITSGDTPSYREMRQMPTGAGA